jgi:hypothetical protein
MRLANLVCFFSALLALVIGGCGDDSVRDAANVGTVASSPSALSEGPIFGAPPDPTPVPGGSTPAPEPLAGGLLVVNFLPFGVRVSASIRGVPFDLLGNGTADCVGLLGFGSGFLARDIDGTGVIHDGKQLFGPATLLQNGQKAANGFAALKDLDDDGDGQITPADKAWSSLGVVHFLDTAGLLPGAFHFIKLGALGIKAVPLSPTAISAQDWKGDTADAYVSTTTGIGTPVRIVDISLATIPSSSAPPLSRCARWANGLSVGN